MKSHITRAKEKMSEAELAKLEAMATAEGITLDEMIERLCKAVIYSGEIKRLTDAA